MSAAPLGACTVKFAAQRYKPLEGKKWGTIVKGYEVGKNLWVSSWVAVLVVRSTRDLGCRWVQPWLKMVVSREREKKWLPKFSGGKRVLAQNLLRFHSLIRLDAFCVSEHDKRRGLWMHLFCMLMRCIRSRRLQRSRKSLTSSSFPSGLLEALFHLCRAVVCATAPAQTFTTSAPEVVSSEAEKVADGLGGHVEGRLQEKRPLLGGFGV